MYVVITILILIVCLLLSLIVLVQNPKGGGLNQSLGGVSNQVFGAKRSTNLVEKVTWYMAIAVMVLSLGSAAFISKTDTVEQNRAEQLQQEGELVTPSFEPNNTVPLPGTEQ